MLEWKKGPRRRMAGVQRIDLLRPRFVGYDLRYS
jgi:hypothetical protein